MSRPPRRHSAEVGLQRILIVGAAGAAGCIVRYLVGQWAGQRLGTAFPYGTLVVNLAGCFLIALVMELSLGIASFPPNLRLGLTTGFMGGLTTYSSFNYEGTKLAFEGALDRAAISVGLTFVGCFIAGLLGLALGRRLVGG